MRGLINCWCLSPFSTTSITSAPLNSPCICALLLRGSLSAILYRLIISHTWSHDDEVSFQDMLTGVAHWRLDYQSYKAPTRWLKAMATSGYVVTPTLSTRTHHSSFRKTSTQCSRGTGECACVMFPWPISQTRVGIRAKDLDARGRGLSSNINIYFGRPEGS